MPSATLRARKLRAATWCLFVLGGIAAGLWWLWSTKTANSLGQAAELYKLRDWLAAEKLVRAHLKKNPLDPAALRLLSRSLSQSAPGCRNGARLV
jgi:hypothetical protein